MEGKPHIENKPLIALGLDKMTLTTAGMSPDDIRKIYRALYVSSNSVFAMIRETTTHVPREKERAGT
jgi:hypothetical protein